MRLLAAILLLAICGCASQAQHSAAAAPAAVTHRSRVYLIRGFQDWYSSGVYTLEQQLQTHGFDAQACAESDWEDVAKTVVDGVSDDQPLVLIGFSYGADDVISIARACQQRHRRVDLLITIDPVTPGKVPANVVRCVNFYQPNGVWDALPWLRGIPLQSDDSADSTELENINVRERADLIEPNTSHATIAANERIHATIIDLVLTSEPAAVNK